MLFTLKRLNAWRSIRLMNVSPIRRVSNRSPMLATLNGRNTPIRHRTKAISWIGPLIRFEGSSSMMLLMKLIFSRAAGSFRAKFSAPGSRIRFSTLMILSLESPNRPKKVSDFISSDLQLTSSISVVLPSNLGTIKSSFR
uniref:(northern house mosquito) hypothetical protein n=1 Tax=Culex pipiens TaxID=7175 RepID=A0A8D8MWF0_CULPI